MSGDGWVTLKLRGGRGATVMLPVAHITAVREHFGESYHETVIECGGKEYCVEDYAEDVKRLVLAASKKESKECHHEPSSG